MRMRLRMRVGMSDESGLRREESLGHVLGRV